MSEKAVENTATKAGETSGFLLGRYEYALDPKKRFTIPSPWRKILGDPEYVFVMPDSTRRCLNILPQPEMEARLAKLREKSLFEPKLAAALRTIGANSEQLPVDVQGRIKIGDRLRQFAGLESRVAMVGAVRKIEIWNPEELGGGEKVDQQAFGQALEEAGF